MFECPPWWQVNLRSANLCVTIFWNFTWAVFRGRWGDASAEDPRVKKKRWNDILYKRSNGNGTPKGHIICFPMNRHCHGPSTSPERHIISHSDKSMSVSPFLVVRRFYLSHIKILIRTSQHLVQASWQKYTEWRKHKNLLHSVGNISIFP